MAQYEIPGNTLCTCQQERGSMVLPHEGQSVRVKFIKDFHCWEGSKQVVIRAGTTYEGIATDIDTEEGFFDVIDAEENRLQFYIHDSTIQVEMLAHVAA